MNEVGSECCKVMFMFYYLGDTMVQEIGELEHVTADTIQSLVNYLLLATQSLVFV